MFIVQLKIFQEKEEFLYIYFIFTVKFYLITALFTVEIINFLQIINNIF